MPTGETTQPPRPFAEFIENPFTNRAGRLRSVWRFFIFVVVLVVVFLFASGLLFGLLDLALPSSRYEALLGGLWGYVIEKTLHLLVATLVGYACLRVIEELPWRALGWGLHRGWMRDLLFGSLVGAASILLCTAIALAAGGFRFTHAPAVDWPLVAQTLAGALLVFVIGGAAEEVIFRGYPLQTLMRSWPAWAALIPSSLLFSAVHLFNPNVARGFTFINTLIAGVWLGVAYLRTRSLWFPLGVHWAWNWTMGALLGLPVSGITKIAPVPLLRAADTGPAWLTGGDYGLEGGAACTLALLLSTLFIWRTKLLSAPPDLKAMTDQENPDLPPGPITLRRTEPNDDTPPDEENSVTG